MKTKQTEIGIIPEDWEVKRLGEIGELKNGINKSKDAFGFGFPFVNLMDVFGVSSINSSVKMGLLDSTAFERKLYGLVKGDILFIRSSVKPSGVGLTAVVLNDLTNVVFSGFLIRFRDSGLLNLEYKKYCFYEERFRNKIIDSSTISANTNINQNALKVLLIPIPPLAEQKRIAEALSDMDALIANLDALIEKKRNLKQATMQTLLTPKVGWEVKKIKEVASITTGAKNTQDKIENGLYPFFVRSQTIERINSYSFDGEAVLTAGDGVGTGKVFHYINGKFDIHQRVYMISNFVEKLNGYYFFLFFRSFFYERIMQMTAKSSVDSVRKEMIAEMLIPLPPLPEQQSIAQILSDMDSELSGLEGKRAKYKTLKTGMMQALLTGRVRLV